MDTAYLVSFFQESLYLIIVFTIFLLLALWKGRYMLINIILALYLGLLFTLEFPYFNKILDETNSASTNAFIKIGLFSVITILGIFLFRRHIPGDDFEKPFSGLWKKLLLSTAATGLILAFSYHILPVTELIHPGTPIQTLFSPDTYFYWWLMLPIVILFII